MCDVWWYITFWRILFYNYYNFVLFFFFYFRRSYHSSMNRNPTDTALLWATCHDVPPRFRSRVAWPLPPHPSVAPRNFKGRPLTTDSQGRQPLWTTPASMTSRRLTWLRRGLWCFSLPLKMTRSLMRAMGVLRL